MTSQLFTEFKQGFREGPAVFFAPLIGMYRVLSSATRRVEIEAAKKVTRVAVERYTRSSGTAYAREKSETRTARR